MQPSRILSPRSCLLLPHHPAPPPVPPINNTSGLISNSFANIYTQIEAEAEANPFCKATLNPNGVTGARPHEKLPPNILPHPLHTESGSKALLYNFFLLSISFSFLFCAGEINYKPCVMSGFPQRSSSLLFTLLCLIFIPLFTLSCSYIFRLIRIECNL